jgi:hypothetical protein
MVSFVSFCGSAVLPIPPAFGATAERALAYPQMQSTVAWGLALLLIAAALALLQQLEVRSTRVDRPRAGDAIVPGLVRRRLPAVWRIGLVSEVHPLRSGAGGVPGRVPPRPAAGSNLPLRLAYSARGRRR